MPPGTLKQLLAGLSPEQRATFKAEGLAALIEQGSLSVGNITVSASKFTTYTLNGVTISLTSIGVERGCLALTLTAEDERGPLPVPDYAAGDRFLFRNPPIGRWTRLPSESDPGETAEDPIGVAKQFIYEAVVTYAGNHGWSHG